jgi:hypothetical protein
VSAINETPEHLPDGPPRRSIPDDPIMSLNNKQQMTEFIEAANQKKFLDFSYPKRRDENMISFDYLNACFFLHSIKVLQIQNCPKKLTEYTRVFFDVQKVLADRERKENESNILEALSRSLAMYIRCRSTE